MRIDDVIAYLAFGELQGLGQSLPLWGGQVLMGLELLLQLHRLVIGKPDLSALSFMEGALHEVIPQKRFGYN